MQDLDMQNRGMMSTDSQPVLPAARPHPFNLVADDLIAERYQLESQLNQWPSGVTWRAVDRTLSRRVVVHLFDPASPDCARVLDAARQAAVAVDSRFVRVLDAMDGDKPFVVTEFATGVSLRALLAHGPVTALEAAQIIHQLADALAPMHSEGLFHRRLNPDTVLITHTGHVKIVGFLTDAALAGGVDPHENWARQEAADVHALGKMLYACLVAHWPIDAGLAQTSQWGLPAAPMAAPGPDGPHWAPPRQVDPRVPPTLDAICIQIFDPRTESVPLRTADELVIALGRVLGTAEVDEILGRRITALPAGDVRGGQIGLHAPGVDELPARPVPDADDDAPSLQRTPIDGDADWPFTSDDSAPMAPRTSTNTRTSIDEATGPMPVGTDTGTVPVGAGTPAIPVGTVQTFVTRLPPRDDDDDELSDSITVPTRQKARESSTTHASPEPANTASENSASVDDPAFDDDDDPDGDEPVGVSGKLVGPLPERGTPPRRLATATRREGPLRWVLPVVVALMVLVALNGMVRSCQSGADKAPAAVQAASVVEFDPVADGGAEAEMPDEVPLATDGDTATAWHTQEYGGSAQFGSVKPGSGLMLDLGQTRTINSVQLTLVGAPTDVQLLVTNDDANPSTSTVNDWTVMASATADGTTVTLTPSAPISGRHLLVYLSSLPQLTNGNFQGAIAEITLNAA